MSKNNNVLSLGDIAGAAFRFAPHLPAVIRNNRKLNQLRDDDIQSTGLMFETLAASQPNKAFLMFEDKTWTYSEFNQWVNRLARCFKAQGVGSGDCIALMFENCPELLACVLATNKLGAIAGMVNQHQRGEVLLHSLSVIKPLILVAGPECLEGIAPLRPQLERDMQLYSYGTHSADQSSCNIEDDLEKYSHSNISDTQNVQLRQKCYYVFTSGTTGLPKAASMTHFRWFKAGLGMGVTAMRLNRSDVMYCPLPLYHNNALTVALSSVICSGATLALTRKFSVSNFWAEIKTSSATSFIYVGELCRYLLNAPANPDSKDNKIRVIIGNGMRPEIWSEFKNCFRIKHICEFYGASENGTSFINIFNLKRTAGYCPTSYAIVSFDPERETPIRSKLGKFTKVNRGEAGLLLTEVTRSVPFDGYSDSKASEAKVFRNVFNDGDCWFNTGDLVLNQGYRHIAFVDRVGDTFRWKGENVATTEVEGVIQKYHGVEEAVVYGVQVPNADGRAGMCAITLAKGKDIDMTKFYQFLSSRLPSYGIPLFLRVRNTQETTSTFKLRKTELKLDGFSINNSGEPVYALQARQQHYELLTPDLYNKLAKGVFRF